MPSTIAIKQTCKDCKDRKIGCHANCSKYLNAKYEHDKKLSDYRRRYKKFSDAMNYFTTNHRKGKRGEV